MTDISELSERELEILQLVATGASNKEIASQLYISTNTVKVHLRNIFTKIGAASRTEAAMYAVQSGLVKAGGGAEQGLGNQFPADENQTSKSSFFYRNIAIALIGLLLIAAIIFGVSVLQNPDIFTSPQKELVAEETRWQNLSDLPTARRGLAVTAFENTIYAIAGESAEGVTGMTEIYHPETDTWETGIQKPVPVVDVQAETVRGKIYLPGGQLASGEVTNILEIYNPISEIWERGADMPVGVSAYAMAAYEGKLYIFGGQKDGDYLASVFVYDPISNRWDVLSTMNSPRAYASVEISEGKVYLFGGENNSGFIETSAIYTPFLEGSDISPWSEGELMPDSRSRMGSASIAGSLYLIGGIGGKRDYIELMVYTPSSNLWINHKKFFIIDSVWENMGVERVGNMLYLVGGKYNGNISDNFQSYKVVYTLSIPGIIN